MQGTVGTKRQATTGDQVRERDYVGEGQIGQVGVDRAVRRSRGWVPSRESRAFLDQCLPPIDRCSESGSTWGINPVNREGGQGLRQQRYPRAHEDAAV